MGDNDALIEGWQEVEAQLRLILASQSAMSATGCGSLHLRLAKLLLWNDALRQPPELWAERFEGAVETGLSDLWSVLEAQLDGRKPDFEGVRHLSLETRSAALSEVDEGLVLDPGHRSLLRARIVLCRALDDEAGTTAALRLLAHLPGLPESMADALTDWGEQLWRALGDPAGAVQAFEQALALFPEDLVLIDKVLKVDLELERWVDAVAACQHLIAALDKGHSKKEFAVTYLLTLGEIHLQGLGAPGLALGFYLEAVARLPTHALTFQLLGELFEGHHQEVKVAVEALWAHPSDDARRRHLAELLRGAVRHNPTSPRAAVKAFQGALEFI